MTLYLKGQKSCKMSKFEVKNFKIWYLVTLMHLKVKEVSKKVKHDLVPQGAPKLQDVKFSSFYFKLGHLVTLMPLEVQGRALPF